MRGYILFIDSNWIQQIGFKFFWSTESVLLAPLSSKQKRRGNSLHQSTILNNWMKASSISLLHVSFYDWRQQEEVVVVVGSVVWLRNAADVTSCVSLHDMLRGKKSKASFFMTCTLSCSRWSFFHHMLAGVSRCQPIMNAAHFFYLKLSFMW